MCRESYSCVRVDARRVACCRAVVRGCDTVVDQALAYRALSVCPARGTTDASGLIRMWCSEGIRSNTAWDIGDVRVAVWRAMRRGHSLWRDSGAQLTDPLVRGRAA